MGRVLRPVDGKTAVIIDMVQNYEEHGSPCDDREWQLETTKKKEKKKDEDDISIKQCEDCFAVTKMPASVCSECGEPFLIKKRKQLEFTRDIDIAEIDFTNRKYQKVFVDVFGEFCKSVKGWKKQAAFFTWKKWESLGGNPLTAHDEKWIDVFANEPSWNGTLISFINYNKKLYKEFEQWQKARV